MYTTISAAFILGMALVASPLCADQLTDLIAGKTEPKQDVAAPKVIEVNTSELDDKKIQKRLQKIFSEMEGLKKISIDYAVMQPASADPQVRVAAVPMALTWLDVGSWPAYAETCVRDKAGNALAAEKHLLMDSRNTLVASSDPNHLIATIGCEDLVVIHTPRATLVCRADQAQKIKEMHAQVGKTFGKSML